MFKILTLSLAAAASAAGLAFWRNSQPIELAGKNVDLSARTAVMEDIQRQIDLLHRRQAGTRQILERLQEDAEIQVCANRYRIRKPLAALIFAAATAHEFEPDLIFRIVDAESNFNPSDVSPKGAVGLMQVMPATGALYGVDRGGLFDPDTNLNVGLLHLRNCLWAENNDIVKALDRYNRGNRPDALHRYASRILKGESFNY
jgi:soluble lytic murein transglycosylase-like protein